ncbi:MAG: hypothetical protein ISF22_04880 [Methanomassiliicoccus sp.]|nr:hypothetical protein [Methanomassiliicoccus sp.]
MAPADNNLALALVPPLAIGTSFLAPALAICLACLFGVMVLGAVSRRVNLRMLTPAAYCLLLLALVLGALVLWTALS